MIIIGYYYGMGISATRIATHSKRTKYGMSFGIKQLMWRYSPDDRHAKGSGRVYVQAIVRAQGEPVLFFRHGYNGPLPNSDWHDPISGQAMRRVSDKLGFRRWAQDNGISVPMTWTKGNELDFEFPIVGRPLHHSKGCDFHRYDTPEDYEASNDGYYSALLDKVREYRVYVFNGYVFAYSEKIPVEGIDGFQPWNHSLGNTTFKIKTNRWWHKAVCFEALKACYKLGIIYAGVDVIIDRSGKLYIIEINTAASLDGHLKPANLGKLLDRYYDLIVAEQSVEVPDPTTLSAFRHPWLKEEVQNGTTT